MTLRISRAAHDALLAEVAARPDREVCGLLVGHHVVTAIRPARNVAENPADSFEIDPGAVFEAIRAERSGGPRLFGYYHSHPTGDRRPSAHDRAQGAGDTRIWVIAAGGAASAWRLRRDASAEAIPIDIVD